MSRVDEELAQALAESESNSASSGSASSGSGAADSAPEGQPVTRDVSDGGSSSRPRSKGSLGLLIGLLVMGGGILTLVMTSFDNSQVYARQVDQVLNELNKLQGRTVRVEGTLVKGTLRRRDEPCEYRFSMSKGSAVLPVRYPQCIVPDTFRDMPDMDVKVTAEGKLTAAGELEAHQIFAKCPSKYEMQDRANKGEKMPHQASGPSASLH
ncbi:MAG TPA: cytochrome c maturation protein CcmE [Polyangiaceae bacterium]|nr:cytochrome c maturation protein CcmE [Polyangiaceae bacterium]